MTIKPLRILVAEDNKTYRETLEAMLDRRGHMVEAVEDGQQLLEKLASGGRYDVVITDNDMPVMTGIQALRRIRANGQDIPVIVHTTVKGEAVKADIEMSGGVFLSKTSSSAEIFAAIEKQ